MPWENLWPPQGWRPVLCIIVLAITFVEGKVGDRVTPTCSVHGFCVRITLLVLQCVVTCGNNSIFFKIVIFVRIKWIKTVKYVGSGQHSTVSLGLSLTVLSHSSHSVLYFIHSTMVYRYSWVLSVDQSPEFRNDENSCLRPRSHHLNRDYILKRQEGMLCVPVNRK